MDLSISKTTPVAAILKLFELSATLCTAKNPVPCGYKKNNKVSKRYTLSDTIYNAIISCQFTKNVNKKLSNFFSKLASFEAELLQEGIFFLVHLFARDILVMKKLEIEKTKPTFIISVLKVEY